MVRPSAIKAENGARGSGLFGQRVCARTARPHEDRHARIGSIEPGFYRIPLPVALSNSTHGEMTYFELITVRVRDADGAEGVGYTYTVGANGGAIHALIWRATAPRSSPAPSRRIEALWQKMWWALHYGGRGGPAVLAISAVDIALWDLKARRADLPLWRLLGGYDPQVPCYAGGIDLDFPLDALLRADRRQPRARAFAPSR